MRRRAFLALVGSAGFTPWALGLSRDRWAKMPVMGNGIQDP